MQISDYALKSLIFNEPGLTFEQKENLMDQVSAVSEQAGPHFSAQELMGSGLGALTGYVAAKSVGAGPITTAAAAIIGGLGGGQLAKPFEEEHTLGIPGFYLPY